MRRRRNECMPGQQAVADGAAADGGAADDAMTGGTVGWSWNRSSGEWRRVEADRTLAPVVLARPLRVATLNVLKDDAGNAEALRHSVRHEAICDELMELDADVIGLNEVTATFLARLLRDERVRATYTVSTVLDDSMCQEHAAVRGLPHMGNVLLSRWAPVALEYVTLATGRSREVHVMTLSLCPAPGARPLRVACASAHFQAFPWLFERIRRTELHGVAAELWPASSSASATPPDGAVIMGDFNFHREAETSSIPEGWSEFPSVRDLGPTWDSPGNPMLNIMLPQHNVYNGMGTGFGWPNRLRLDRVVARGGALDRESATARLFANARIHNGQEAVTEPWQEYLFPSDHFGIVVDIPLLAAAPPGREVEDGTGSGPTLAPAAGPLAWWRFGF